MSKPLYYLTFDIQYLEKNQKPSEEKCLVSSKAGYFYMNLAAIDEEDQCEILKIFELEKASWEMWYPKHPEYEKFDFQRKHKGSVSFDQHNVKISDPS